MASTRSPQAIWPHGTSADIPTVGGTVTNSLVNSIELYLDNDNQVESGWYLDAGRNRFNPFATSSYNGVYTIYEAVAPAGNFTFKYTVKYSETGCTVGNPCFIAYADNAGGNYMTFGMPYATFPVGYSITDVERHDYSDNFSGTPTFTNLQSLSSTAWSYWPAAVCGGSDDPLYGQTYFTNPTKVTVVVGSSC
ncbi:MAG: hypothetical protein QOG34_1581 [Frankiaceae bacterium]|jgi:hypothetical protein|nr:hypothetical protein [Frankiaceae bacterium]